MKRINALIASAMFVVVAALAPSAHSAIISGTWNFSAAGLTGSFSFTGLDTGQKYFDSTVWIQRFGLIF